MTTNRVEAFRKAAAWDGMRTFRRLWAAVERAKELAALFDTAVTAAGNPLVTLLGDTVETACLPNRVLAAVDLLERETVALSRELPLTPNPNRRRRSRP